MTYTFQLDNLAGCLSAWLEFRLNEEPRPSFLKAKRLKPLFVVSRSEGAEAGTGNGWLVISYSGKEVERLTLPIVELERYSMTGLTICLNCALRALTATEGAQR